MPVLKFSVRSFDRMFLENGEPEGDKIKQTLNV